MITFDVLSAGTIEATTPEEVVSWAYGYNPDITPELEGTTFHIKGSYLEMRTRGSRKNGPYRGMRMRLRDGQFPYVTRKELRKRLADLAAIRYEYNPHREILEGNTQIPDSMYELRDARELCDEARKFADLMDPYDRDLPATVLAVALEARNTNA